MLPRSATGCFERQRLEPLAIPDCGTVVLCTYCERELVVEGHQARRRATAAAATVTDDLLRGYTGRDHGQGRRNSVAEMTVRDWRCVEYGLWPVSGRASSEFRHDSGEEDVASPLDPALRAPTSSVAGTSVRCEAVSPGSLQALRPTWATELIGCSSRYGEANWSGERALGAPNVYPQHGDDVEGWASRETDRGVEWIAVRFPERVDARAILLVETFNPGALARVDDITDEQHPVELWKRETPGSTRSRIVRLDLAQPRQITALRVILDTRRQAGWNEIDAIGLVPRRRYSPSISRLSSGTFAQRGPIRWMTHAKTSSRLAQCSRDPDGGGSMSACAPGCCRSVNYYGGVSETETSSSIRVRREWRSARRMAK